MKYIINFDCLYINNSIFSKVVIIQLDFIAPTAVIEAGVNFIFGKLADGESRAQRLGEVVFGILSAVLVVMAAITFIATGGWLVALGYLLAAAVSGAIANAVKGRATGGVVSENMTLVGERGPEVISPSGNVDITPNFALGGGETNVNFTINAVDAAGVEDVLRNQQGNIIRITPPLIISQKELKNGLDIISKSL